MGGTSGSEVAATLTMLPWIARPCDIGMKRQATQCTASQHREHVTLHTNQTLH